MAHTSDKKSSGRFDRAGIVIFFLCMSLSLLQVSCSSSSSPTSSPDARLNQHLVYGNQIEKDATLKPHQTVALNLSSLEDDHLSARRGSSYHNLPYEITNAGKYKYCIPDDDTHLTQVELFDPANTLVASWKKGEPCTSVPLIPGNYSMHVHLDTTESDPTIFMKPHDVKITQTGTMKVARKSVSSSYDGQIPINQFLSLKVESLTDVLIRNRVLGLKEGWGVLTSTSKSDSTWTSLWSEPAYWKLQQPQFFYNETFGGRILANSAVIKVPNIGTSDLLYLSQQEGGKVLLLQGEKTAGVFPNICLTPNIGGYINSRKCVQTGSVIGLFPSGSTVDSDSWFSFSPSGLNFSLGGANGSPVNWYAGMPNVVEWATGAGSDRVNFNVKVRYGSTSGLVYPSMLANEVALFDGSYEASGFPANTHYWIVNADMKDFNDFAFDNPDQRIKTVIAGRGARAQLFQNPSFQGDSVYVSPPVDGEMLLTGSDNDLLKNGTIGSIRIGPNTNNIPVNEYEYHIIVSANTCIGCDLRGFDASSSGVTYANSPKKYIKNANFSDSDLSYSNFSINHGQGGFISDSNFSRVNFTGATLTNNSFFSCNFSKTDLRRTDLTNAYFGSCNFIETDFTEAVLNKVSFYKNPKINPEHAFYNACPKFEHADLTSLYISSQNGFDSYFPVVAGSVYNADTWWNNGRPICRTSIANSMVTADLFKDKRLWQFVDAPGVDFSNMNLDGAVFAGSNLRNAIFKNASLKGTVFVKADLSGADLNGADLTGAHLEGATLTGVNLHKAKTLSRTFLSGISLDAPNLSNLDMSGTQLKGGKYTNWDGHTFEEFLPASIIGAYMLNTKLNGADLSGAALQHVSWYGDQATGENAIMVGTHFEIADMPGLKLNQAHLQEANFTDAVLVNADLSTTTLDHSFVGTSFYQANLKGANLSGANLFGANLKDAHIYVGTSQQTATLEVLDDPITNQNQYIFFKQTYSATKLPASTNGIVYCPKGSPSPANNCGDIGSDLWITSATIREPADCYLRAAQPGENSDDQGMVLICTSNRHSK